MAAGKAIEQYVDQTLEKNYMPYAMSVIVSRALPEIDGFKPSHRKLLYTMYKMGLLTGSRTKSANVVGQTMKLNPHGDSAIYETLVRLTRGNSALLHSYIDSKGNFGKHYSRDMHYAAPRYTEVKLDGICSELIRDLDKDTVDFIDNYDGSMKEPVLFPTSFPNILVNANQGIAVGMANSICSFNLTEVCDAAVAYIRDPGADIKKYLKSPDFSTGGQLIYKESEIDKIYKSGRGSFKVRAKYKFDSRNNCIEIYEIPYTTTSEAIIDSIIELVKSNRIREIVDVRDETDLKGMKITLDLRKSANPDELMNKLYRFTSLQDSFSCNFNILIDGYPQVLGVGDILKHWLSFRIGCIRRQLLYDINKKSEKLHLLIGLKKILLDIDKAIEIIRNTKQDKEVIPNLMDGFAIDEKQAEYIAEIKLRNLNMEYVLDRVSEVDGLRSQIADLKRIHGSEESIKKIIIKQLHNIKKRYGKERFTEIIMEEHVEEFSNEQLIQDYNLKLFLTRHNYLKKISLVSLRGKSDQKLKDEDKIMQEIETHNKADILLFSDKHTVYKARIFELEDCKASELGEYLPNILGLDNNEKILYMVVTDNYEGNMLFTFENGKSAKIELKSYQTKTNRKKLTNAYSDKSALIDIRFLKEDVELAAFSNINKVLIFDTSNINEKSTRTSQGVQVLKPKRGSKMVRIKAMGETAFKNGDYYRTKNVPAVGRYLLEEDENNTQLELIAKP